MGKMYQRQSLSVGSKVKISHMMSTVDANNVPYWKFYIPFSIIINGHSVVYKHLWCRVAGKPFVNEGDWIQITAINGYKPNCRRDDIGGMSVYEDLFVEIEKLYKENNDDNDSL